MKNDEYKGKNSEKWWKIGKQQWKMMKHRETPMKNDEKERKNNEKWWKHEKNTEKTRSS